MTLNFRFKHIDTLGKVNFVFVNHLIEFVNGTKNFSFVNTWGYYDKSINMYSGMIGTLQRDETEIGGTKTKSSVIECKSNMQNSHRYSVIPNS